MGAGRTERGPVPTVRTPAPWRGRLRGPGTLRTLVVVTPLLAMLGIVAGTGARMLWADPGSPVVQEKPVTCWDRYGVDEVGDCSLPTGVAGLRWVFPSFKPGRDDCTDVLVTHPEYTRPTMWQCSAVVSGRTATVTFSELTSLESGLAHHEREYADAKKSAFPDPDGRVVRYVWRRPQPNDEGSYEMAAMYVEFPYAVSIEAPTLRIRDRVFEDIVLRDPDRISVRSLSAP